MGRKLRATGNGRCNITNVNAEGFSEVTSFLSSLGIVTKTNDNGFLYLYLSLLLMFQNCLS